MRRINVAHEWLTDPIRRAEYDISRAPARTETAAGPLPNWDDRVEDETAAEDESEPVVPKPGSDVPRSPAVPTAFGLLRYFVSSGVAVGLAYIGSVLASMVMADTGMPLLATVVVGEDGTFSLLNLAGNLVFAVLMGYLVGGYSLDLLSLRSRYGGLPRPLLLVGTLAALAFTFGFPAFSISYLGEFASWLVAEGVLGVVVTGALQALFVALLVLLAAWLGGAEWVARMDRQEEEHVRSMLDSSRSAAVARKR